VDELFRCVCWCLAVRCCWVLFVVNLPGFVWCPGTV
jgi:hypothetical protein